MVKNERNWLAYTNNFITYNPIYATIDAEFKMRNTLVWFYPKI